MKNIDVTEAASRQGAATSRLARALERLRARRERRESVRALARLDAAALADIGLGRTDVFALEHGAITVAELDARRHAGLGQRRARARAGSAAARRARPAGRTCGSPRPRSVLRPVSATPRRAG